jgi:GTPase
MYNTGKLKIMAQKPLVALVGRPNVGKSTLFNRLVGERMAVTHDIPGTTRDRLVSESDWNGVTFNVVDTGGIEVYQPKDTRDVSPLAEGSIDFVAEIRSQALLAIEEADVIVLLVDATHGITAADEEIAEVLRRTNKPIIIAANKTDTLKTADDSFEFYALGIGQVVPISAIHGLGIGDLLDEVINLLVDAEVSFDDTDDDHLKIAIMGRPNAGKSTLLNHIIGEERAIVSPVAGTTRDAIDTTIKWNGEDVTLIDTAGIRRRGKINPGVEKFSVIRAMKAIERADVVLLIVDALEGITDMDEHIAGFVMDAYKGLIIVVNKWDVVDKKDSHTMNAFKDQISDRLKFVSYAPSIFISALTGQRIHKVLEIANRVYETRFMRISTSEVNNLLRDALKKHPPPMKGTKQLKIYFGSQVATAPPVFLFHVNDTKLVHFTYKRYLANRFREEYPFEGTPIRLSFRESKGAPKREKGDA